MESKQKSIAYIKKLVKLCRAEKVQTLIVDGITIQVSAMGLVDAALLNEGIGEANSVKKDSRSVGSVSKSTHPNQSQDAYNEEDEDMFWSST